MTTAELNHEQEIADARIAFEPVWKELRPHVIEMCGEGSRSYHAAKHFCWRGFLAALRRREISSEN